MSVGTGDYSVDVIKAWDDASEHFKKAAIRANADSLGAELWLLDKNRLLVPRNSKITQVPTKKVTDSGNEIQTDGVGTKVRIYMRAFNGLYEKYRANKSEHNKKQLEAIARDLFYRMFLDLYAMNVDDFRHGDIALAVSDILDIDHITLSGEDAEQGEIFCNAFAHAIGRIIETTKIACVAGETAVLGDGDKLNDTRRNLGWVVSDVLELNGNLKRIDETTNDLPPAVQEILTKVRRLVDNARGAQDNQEVIDRSVELNLGWSTTGYRGMEKLAPLWEGQVVIALFEKKTAKWIISPRANGISAIRKTMENLLGSEWALKTLQDYFDILDSKDIAISADKKENLSKMGLDTPLWDIATGETTVFNPFVAGTLLGGAYDEPLFPGAISGQIHVTGNPIGKWSDVVADSGLGIDVDYTGVEIPQIIEMCTIAEWQSFADGMKKFNMGIPYALVCSPENVQQIIDTAWYEWYSAGIVGKLTKPDENEKPVINITYPGWSFQAGVEGIR